MSSTNQRNRAAARASATITTMSRPTDLEQSLGYCLPVNSPDACARAAALAALPESVETPTSLVSYQSRGSLLIIGATAQALPQVAQLGDGLRCTVLVTEGEADRAETPSEVSPDALERIVYARAVKLSGHLGQYTMQVALGDKVVNLAQTLDREREHFDIVLDLGQPAQLLHEVPPLGYYAPGDDPTALERALAEIPGLVGEFEKPKYFNYDPNICAHGASGLKGCTRCLDACPTNAISSLGDHIAVDPYLCQGAGGCAAACPTGAITYAYPAPSDLTARLRALLHAYREAGGKAPRLLLHDVEKGGEWVRHLATSLPASMIPVAVEEVGSVGMETWLAALAYGATEVVLLCPPTVPHTVGRELADQLRYADTLQRGLGYPGGNVRLAELRTPEELDNLLDRDPDFPEFEPATFKAFNEKRVTIRMALDHLLTHAPSPREVVELPQGAPFGEIRVNVDTCTLCMACVSVCPAGALVAGGETPKLSFIEWNCVQCGLCETACPEDAISRRPRMVFDQHGRGRSRTLNEDQPFLCVSCGKPFATQSVLRRMQEKLKSHWMFQKPEAMRRLQMCDACRVKDMFVQEGGMMRSHREPQAPDSGES